MRRAAVGTTIHTLLPHAPHLHYERRTTALEGRSIRRRPEPARRAFDGAKQKQLAGIIAKLAPRAANGSPMIALQAVSALRRRVEDLELEVVILARGCNWSWTEISSLLGTSRSAVHRRFAKVVTERGDEQPP